MQDRSVQTVGEQMSVATYRSVCALKKQSYVRIMVLLSKGKLIFTVSSSRVAPAHQTVLVLLTLVPILHALTHVEGHVKEPKIVQSMALVELLLKRIHTTRRAFQGVSVRLELRLAMCIFLIRVDPRVGVVVEVQEDRMPIVQLIVTTPLLQMARVAFPMGCPF